MNTLDLTGLDLRTHRIKRKEARISSNFVGIGKELKEIRDGLIYKERFDEFGDYVSTAGFNFSERHAYRLISIVEKFNDIDATKLGVAKCIQLLRLEEEDRQTFIEKNSVELMSVSDLKIQIEEILNVQKRQSDLINESETTAPRITIFEKNIDRLSEEIDGIIDRLVNLSSNISEPNQSSNVRNNTVYQKVQELNNKINKAKQLIVKLKPMTAV